MKNEQVDETTLAVWAKACMMQQMIQVTVNINTTNNYANRLGGVAGMC